MSDERQQAIRERAYAIWEQEGRPDGQSLPHWLLAESEIGPKHIVGVLDDGKIVGSSRRTAGRKKPKIA